MNIKNKFTTISFFEGKFYLELSATPIVVPGANGATTTCILQGTLAVPFAGIKFSGVRGTVAVAGKSLAMRLVLEEVAIQCILSHCKGRMGDLGCERLSAIAARKFTICHAGVKPEQVYVGKW